MWREMQHQWILFLDDRFPVQSVISAWIRLHLDNIILQFKSNLGNENPWQSTNMGNVSQEFMSGEKQFVKDSL